MKIFYSKSKLITLMIIFVLLLQVASPLLDNYGYAEDSMEIPLIPMEDAILDIPLVPLEPLETTDEYDPEESIIKDDKNLQKIEQSFTIAEVLVNEEGNKATINWSFVAGDLEESQDYSSGVELILKEEVSGSIESEEKVIGTYKIELDGKINVNILANQTEDAIGVWEVDLAEKIIEEDAFEKLIPSVLEDPVSFDEVKLEHVDGSGNDVTGPFKRDSHVKIKFNYSIVNGVQVDTSKIYEFTIPQEIKIIANLNFQLKDGDRVLANISVKKDGIMTVQFLAEVNNENFDEERIGWITIYSIFDETKIDDGEDKTIIFEVNGVSKSITVEFEKDKVTENITLEKSGSYDTSKNEITWIIKVKPKTEPAGRTINNIVIRDIIQEGQTYIANSAELNGTKIVPDPVTGDSLSYTFNQLQDGYDQMITFKTKAAITGFINQGDTIEFKNTITGTFGEDNKPTNSSEGKVTTTVDFIKKTGKEVAGKGKINWTIEVNNNNLELPAGIEIKDTIGDGLKYNYDLKVDGNPIGNYGTVVESDNEFTLKIINPINKKYTLTYSTNVIDTGAYNSNDKQIYKNKAEITWPGKLNGSTNTGDIGVGVSTNVISKRGAGYNRSTHEITWKIVLNSNKIKITNPIVTEFLDSKLEYVSHSFDKENDKWVFDSGNMTFKYTGEISDTYTITLITKIKDEHKSYFGDNKTQNIPNRVKLQGIGVKDSEATANQQVVSKVIEKFAKGYDYVTRKVKWEIVINQNNMPITNSVVTDVIQGDFHKFVEGSLNIDGVITTEGYQLMGNIITINVGNITKETKVTFETQIPEDKVDEFFKQNGNKELKNNSTLTGIQINGNVNSNATQLVKNTVVSKIGKYVNGNDFIDWEVVINLNELKLNNVILEDILQDGLIFDSQSVIVKQLKINSNGTYTEGNSIVINTNVELDTNKVIFNIGDIRNAYILKFRTDVDDNHKNTTFNNTIKLKGSNGEQDGKSTAIVVNLQTGDAGGSGTSTRGSLSVVKINKQGPSTYLEGAKFELYKSDKITLEATSDGTGLDGTILFGNLRMGTYYIKEIQAPEGYVLDSELKVVKLEKGLTSKYVTYEFENKNIKGSIEFQKEDEKGKPLKGAVFGLYKKDDTDFDEEPVTAESDENGLVRFENILYGEYRIKEIDAPVGYVSSDKILEISIIEDSQTIQATQSPIINKKIIGMIEIIKKGEHGKNLSGAVFELLKGGEVKYTSHPTDNNGSVVFKDIEHGTYTVREKEAPEGYHLGLDTQEVTIETDGEIKRLTFINSKIRGDLRITKVDSRNESIVLKDASFEIRDSRGRLIDEIVTDSNGIAMAMGLENGRYTIVETRAPMGYRLNYSEYVVEINGKNGETNIQVSLTIKNERRPIDPIDPTYPTYPTYPRNPKYPTDTVDPIGPNDPIVTPLDYITDEDEDYIPLDNEEAGKDEEYIEIDEDDTPVGTIHPDNPPKGPIKTLPKTGEVGRVVFYISGLLFMIIGIFLTRRRTE